MLCHRYVLFSVFSIQWQYVSCYYGMVECCNASTGPGHGESRTPTLHWPLTTIGQSEDLFPFLRFAKRGILQKCDVWRDGEQVLPCGRERGESLADRIWTNERRVLPIVTNEKSVISQYKALTAPGDRRRPDQGPVKLYLDSDWSLSARTGLWLADTALQWRVTRHITSRHIRLGAEPAQVATTLSQNCEPWSESHSSDINNNNNNSCCQSWRKSQMKPC